MTSPTNVIASNPFLEDLELDADLAREIDLLDLSGLGPAETELMVELDWADAVATEIDEAARRDLMVAPSGGRTRPRWHA